MMLQNGVVENQAREQFLAVLKQASNAGLICQNLAVIDFTCGTCGYLGLSGKNMKIGGEPALEVLLKALDEDEMANSRLAMSMTAPKGGPQHLRSIEAFNMTLGECIVTSHPGSYKVPLPMSGGVSAVQICFAADAAPELLSLLGVDRTFREEREARGLLVHGTGVGFRVERGNVRRDPLLQ